MQAGVFILSSRERAYSYASYLRMSINLAKINYLAARVNNGKHVNS